MKARQVDEENTLRKLTFEGTGHEVDYPKNRFMVSATYGSKQKKIYQVGEKTRVCNLPRGNDRRYRRMFSKMHFPKQKKRQNPLLNGISNATDQHPQLGVSRHGYAIVHTC